MWFTKSNRNGYKCNDFVKELWKEATFCLKTVCLMKAFNFEQRKESELQNFVGLKGNVVEWRYGYVEKKIDYTLKTQDERSL